MKHRNILVITVIFVLLILTASGTIYAKNDVLLKRDLRLDAIGIATSSGSMQRLKEELLKLKNGVRTVSSIENLANKYSKKKIESK